MELNLLESVDRPVDRSDRLRKRLAHTPRQRADFCRFDHEYFDGESGYGGYYYDGRHEPAVRRMIDHYRLGRDASVLDVGCAKGFMLYEFHKLGITGVRGCDVSRYAVEHAKPEISDRLDVLGADRLCYPDKSFDLAYSIDALHNLEPDACDQAIAELMRVSRAHIFLQVASCESPADEKNLRDWAVTIKTIRTREQWRDAFRRLGYAGDCHFKIFRTL